MKPLLTIFLALICLSPAQAEDEIEFWEDNKISPEQPFPAKVRAVAASWVGYTLLLEEIGGKRVCVGQFVNEHRSYFMIEGEDAINKFSERGKAGWTFLSPPVEVNRFSWSIGAWKIGAIFGKEDIAQKSAFDAKAFRMPIEVPK